LKIIDDGWATNYSCNQPQYLIISKYQQPELHYNERDKKQTLYPFH